jgi:hypothetical protein
LNRWIELGNRLLTVLVELVLVMVCLVFAVVSWRNGLITTSFAESGDTPAFDATRYSGPWLILAAFLVLVAGVIVIDATVRTVRVVRTRPS